MWRGIENIVLERDPREAWRFTQRLCGVRTTVHAMASVRAVEDALNPPNALYFRNLILINHALGDHIVHFYQLSALGGSTSDHSRSRSGEGRIAGAKLVGVDRQLSTRDESRAGFAARDCAALFPKQLEDPI